MSLRSLRLCVCSSCPFERRGAEDAEEISACLCVLCVSAFVQAVLLNAEAQRTQSPAEEISACLCVPALELGAYSLQLATIAWQSPGMVKDSAMI